MIIFGDLTYGDIVTMPAGAEMDELIYKEIFGKESIIGYWIPEYSTEIEYAWELFRSRYLSAQMVGYMLDDPGIEQTELHGERPSDISESGFGFIWMCTCWGKPVYAPTAPLAICRAALLSKFQRDKGLAAK